ncbi:DUF2946 domain-containing protein [Rahnella sp. PD12R]|uniref:DUF2946 domain-containing protein n=1 Tax=Rahnella sp. PD12R TaxID=2855688 RepID=UPI001C44686C|nr:DUF2946 domain-containing protein [Rahnella sp. PD12R]MBV6816868.1 DUF2946 domain-containing protein [Rahnella sp. PD12R]
MLSFQRLHHRHRHFPAWLGIVAILMLFIAPVVSKSRVAEGAQHMMMPGMVMSDMDMPDGEMADMELSDTETSGEHCHPQACKTAQHDTGKGLLSGDMSDAACGYCVLLAHLPLLGLQAMPMLWSLELSSRAPPRSLKQRYVPSLFFTDSQPRAPPVF